MKWLDEAQEWVWMDAVKIGDRVFHASCHREAAGDRREATPGYGRGTPEPVLGKRKAEVCFEFRDLGANIRIGLTWRRMTFSRPEES